jgi:shikimate 5-dehydrogenase
MRQGRCPASNGLSKPSDQVLSNEAGHNRLQTRIDIESLKPGMVVADVISNLPRTHFIEDAERRGCTVVDGLELLVN